MQSSFLMATDQGVAIQDGMAVGPRLGIAIAAL